MEYNTTPYGQLLHRFKGVTNSASIPVDGSLKLNETPEVRELPSRRQSLFTISDTGAFIMDNVSLVSFYLRLRIFPHPSTRQLPYRISLQRDVDQSTIHNTTVVDTLNLNGPTTNTTVFTFSAGMNDPYNVVGGGFNILMFNDGNQDIDFFTSASADVEIDIFSIEYGE